MIFPTIPTINTMTYTILVTIFKESDMLFTSCISVKLELLVDAFNEIFTAVTFQAFIRSVGTSVMFAMLLKSRLATTTLMLVTEIKSLLS